MDWLPEYERLRDAVKSRLRLEDLAAFKVRQAFPNTSDLDESLDALCSYYLVAPEEERKHIRTAFSDPDALWYMGEYLKRVCARIRQQDATKPLRLGLAGASITDGRPALGDFLYSLGYLYRATQLAGVLDPMPVFREVAALSRDDGYESTAGIIAGFDKTRVCKELAEFVSLDLARLVERGDRKSMRKLLASGADVNTRAPNGATLLMIAARRGDSSMVELLLDSGAAINAVDLTGASALDQALRHGHSRAARILSSRGAATKGD
jgi:hypothetical protein